MKRNLLLTTLLLLPLFSFAQYPCSGGTANGYPCSGLTLQSHISYNTLGAYNSPTYGKSGNDSWGWTDPMDGKEYALVGLNNGTAFIDISDPINPRPLGKLPTHTGTYSWWRDLKVYQNHVYVVSEQSNHGMQVFDLTRLRGLSTNANRTFTEDAHIGSFGSAHNIVINEDTGIAYVVGANSYSGGPIFIDITTPGSPSVIGGYSGRGYTHDAQVVTYDGPDPDYQGKEILIGSNEDEVVILDVTNKASIQLISTISYPNYYYTHQGWFTDDKKYFLLGDEEDEVNYGGTTKTIVFDLSDLDNPFIHFIHSGATNAIDHNGYVRGNRFYQSSYRAGLRVLRIDDIESQVMTETDYFDTYPASNSANFNGAWNVYPFFESGNIVITNLDGGFFVVKDPNYDNTPPTVVCQNPTIYLNPSTGSVTIDETDLDGGSTDDFGIVSWSLDGQTTFSCSDIGSTFNVTITATDDYGNENSCTATVTIAASPTTFNGATWSDGTPGPGSHAIIDGTYNSSSQSSIDACTCTVNNGATLRVEANDYLKTEEDINVSGNLIVEHQGSVVQVNPNANVNKLGSGTINVNLTTPNLASRDFMVLGSPMTTESRTGVWNNAWLVLNHITANFVPNPDVEAQMPGAENFADDNYDNWVPFTGSITPGEGYIVRPQASQGGAGGIFNYTYENGTLNNGTVDFNVVYNTPGPTGADNKNASPNVMANPYASAIWANDFISANSMIDEVYFWEHNTPPSPSIPGAGAMNFSMEDISMYNLVGGTAAASGGSAPNGYIATAQGFGIKASAAGTASFTNTMRRTDNNNTLRDPESLDRIWIQVSNQEYEMQSNTLIAFTNEATAGLDSGFDSRRLATVVSLYSHLEDGTQQLGIQSRERFESGVKIPLGFSTLVEGELEYQISIENIEGVNLANATVYLIDHLMDTVTILNDNAYTFSSKEGTYHQRFTILFEKEVTLGPDENELQGIILFPNPTKNNLNIYSPYANLESLEVYDLLGKRISENIEEERKGYTLDLSSLNTGVYFVNITTEKGTTVKKVMKY